MWYILAINRQRTRKKYTYHAARSPQLVGPATWPPPVPGNGWQSTETLPNPPVSGQNSISGTYTCLPEEGGGRV